MPRYAGTPAEWEKVGKALLSNPEGAGVDCEYHNVKIRGDDAQTCYGRAIVHVFSVGLPTGKLSPKGYTSASSVVLPRAALSHPLLTRWLASPAHRKIAHNAAVDVHAVENTLRLDGIEARVEGVDDSLQTARWLWPERAAPGPGFDLKTLAKELLGREPTGKFSELFSVPRRSVSQKKTTSCACLTPGCRKRTGIHVRSTTVTQVVRELVARDPVPLETILPGHALWDTLVKYSGEDAEWAYELDDLARRRGINPKRARPLPW